MHPRRLTLWYVAAVALPTLALLWLTFEAIRDQQDALDVIWRANEDLRREKAETKREAHRRQCVETCLRDPLWDALPDSYSELSRQHGVARHLLLWRDGSTVVPIQTPRLSRSLSEETLAAAELAELSGRDLLRALDAYQRIASMAKHPATRAQALHRTARTLAKLGRKTEASAIWRRLGTDFSDQTDAFGRPYGLLATFEAQGVSRMQVMNRFEHFQNRRWPLTLEQQAFVLERFSALLGPDTVAAAARRLREEDDLSKATGYVVGTSRASNASLVNSKPIVLDGRTFEIWSVKATASEVRGLVVDPGWSVAELALTEPGTRSDNSSSTDWLFGALAAFVAGSLVLAASLLTRASLREAQLGREKAEGLVRLCHDVNNSLTAISVKTQALLQPDALLREDASQTCQMILGRVETLNGWINAYLKRARADAPLPAFNPIVLHRPGVLFERAARSFWDARRCGGRELSIEIQEPLPPTLLDPTAVERALCNLLDNACKYSPPGSTTALRASATDGHVQVEIQNAGEFIPGRDRRRIFDLYHRSKAVAAQHGFGIGLNVVRQVMKAHRGRIEVQSKSSTGTTFHLLFPREADHAQHSDR